MAEKIKVLIVDDSSFTRSVIKKGLLKAGYAVIESENGQAALEALKKEKDISLVTLDVEMPVMDGFATCSEIKKLNREALHILFVTSKDSLDDRKKGFSLGATDFVSKELIRTELVGTVNHILKPDEELKGLTALVADDSETVRNIISEVLTLHGVIVETATDGEEAYNLISANPDKYDMLTTDLNMPLMNGMELTRKIRKELGMHEIPVLMLSASDNKTTQIEMFRAGISDYLTKPFIKEELIARLKSHLYAAVSNKKLKKNMKSLQNSQNKVKKINNEQKELLHVLCHDLANPIGAVLTVLELVEANPEMFDTCKTELKNSALNGIAIIEMVRKMRAVEEKKEQWTLQVLNLKNMIDESLMILQRKFIDKKIELNINVDNNATIVAEATSVVNSVFNNIFTNAIKFSHKKSTIDLTSKDEGDFINISITDRGIGMSEKLLKNIFNVAASTSRPGTNGEIGTGFGMPLIKKFMELYGGSIEVLSKSDRDHPNDHGTEVVLKFPKKN